MRTPLIWEFRFSGINMQVLKNLNLLEHSKSLVGGTLILFFLLLCFLTSCSISSDVNPNEYSKFLQDLSAKRPYPVLRKPFEVPMLIKALEDNNEVARFNAAHDLKAIGSVGREALIPLINRYSDKDRKVAQLSFAASSRVLGEPYLPPEEPGWFFGTDKVDNPVDHLLVYLEKGNEDQKIWSLILLTKMGDSARPVVPRALSLLGDKSPNIRLQSQGFLQKVETSITSQLVDALSSKDSGIRSSACLVLGLREEKSTIDEVRKLLNDPDTSVRFSAAESMVRLGEGSSEIGNILSSGLGVVSPAKETQIVVLLNKIGYSNAVSSYYSQKVSQQKSAQGKLKEDIESRAKIASVKVRDKLLRDREKTKRATALSEDNKRKSIVEIPKLASEIETGTVPERIEALKALSVMSPYYPAAFKPMLDALNNENPSVRSQAAKLLGEQRKAEAVESLIVLLEDESVDVQDSVMAALSIIGTPEALAAISSFPEVVRKEAVNRALRDSSGQIQALVQCSDARSLCRLVLQEAGSPSETINEEAQLCAYKVQPGC